MDPLYWSFILIAVGLGVVVLELFLPSAGILGLLAAVLILAGIICGFMAGFQTGGLILLATVLILPVLLVAMLKIWPSTPIGRRVLLDDWRPNQFSPERQHAPDLVGQLGVAKTKMLPSGIVLVGDQKLDAVSDGFAIEAGQPIIITGVSGNRIYVEPYDGETDAHDLPVRDRDSLAQPFEDLGLDTFDESA